MRDYILQHVQQVPHLHYFILKQNKKSAWYKQNYDMTSLFQFSQQLLNDSVN